MACLHCLPLEYLACVETLPLKYSQEIDPEANQSIKKQQYREDKTRGFERHWVNSVMWAAGEQGLIMKIGLCWRATAAGLEGSSNAS